MDEIDAALVERTLNGERSAYEALVARHLRRARAIAHAIIGRDPLADDAVQEAFLKAYDRLGELSEPGRYAPWLSSIVRNEALVTMRRMQRDRPSQESVSQVVAPIDEIEDPRLDLVRVHLTKLDPDQRAILALTYEAGLDVDGIAATLGLSSGTAEKRLQRARAALQERLERDPNWES